jgi:diguanylate cyclase (GGDEF)-like protein
MVKVHTARTVRSLAPFIGASMLAWGSAPVATHVDWRLYAISAGMAVLAGFVCLEPLRDSLDRVRETVASLIFLLAVAMLRKSLASTSSGVAVVAMLPVFYTALHSSDRRQMIAVTVSVALTFLIPVLVVGAPTYPQTQYRVALMFLAISAVIGLATQQLVDNARIQTAEAQHRERMLEQIAQVVKGLYSSTGEQARLELCEAAMTISDASFAILFEPSEIPGGLRSTAIAGIETDPFEIDPDASASALRAFVSGDSVLVRAGAEDQTISTAVWELSGAPTSILCEPLLAASQTVGVLAVGWPQAIDVNSSRATVITLLAHEVTAIVERADLLSRVTDLASTDPLTGLPNRRAWDTHLAAALAEEEDVVIAMFDFDHFKDFNDTHGHPAGDRLLKESAAAWRDQLRSKDLLARMGGDEFALLLSGCDEAQALTVINRLRRRIPSDQKCSVGLTQRQGAETAEQLLARADEALYEAKSAGRDRACLSS